MQNWMVKLQRGQKLLPMNYGPEPYHRAKIRSENLSYLHGDCKVTKDEEHQTFIVHANDYYNAK